MPQVTPSSADTHYRSGVGDLADEVDTRLGSLKRVVPRVSICESLRFPRQRRALGKAR